jgi:MFS family permease
LDRPLQTHARRNQLTIILLFAMGWAMVFVNRTALYPLLSVIQGEFSLSATRAGLITSSYYFFYVVLQIPAGMAGDRFGHKRVLVISFALSGIGVLAFGLVSSSYGWLLASTVLYGGAAGAFHPMAFSLAMRSISERRRGLATALINSGSALGLIIGLSAAGPFFLLTGNWRLVFAGLAVPTLLLALAFQLAVRPVAPAAAAGTALHLLRNKNLLFIYLASFCSLYAFATAVVWGPTFFQVERGLGLGAAGAYTALVALGGIPAGLIFARLSDRWGRKNLAQGLMPLAALALAGMALVRAPTMAVLTLLLYGAFGKLAWEPIAVAWTGDHVSRASPGSMGTALALFGTIGMTSSIVAPVVAGWIRDRTGSLEGAFLLAAAMLLVGGLFMLVPAETVSRRQPSDRTG